MINVYISYDYELCWGVWDKMPAAYARSNVMQANAAARKLVALHLKHQVPASWAIVGAMLERHAPEEVMAKTARSIEAIDAFRDYVSQFESVNTELFHADADVISALREEPLLEPASHSFSHIYALEEERAVLEDDFRRFDDIFRRTFGTVPISLIFPKNQSSEAAVEIALAYGFRVMRVNPSNWLYVQRKRGRFEAKAIRLLRFLDAFLPILECFPDRSMGHDPVLCVGQYFFRPRFRTKLQYALHLARLRLGLEYCKMRGRSCHFWTHPHNFGGDLERALSNAERLFAILKRQEKRGLIRLCRMSD